MAELKEYTTLRVGGSATTLIEVSTEAEIIKAVEEAGTSPILIVGGGSNLLISDNGFEGRVIHIANNEAESEVDACSGATLSIGAGENWDHFVSTTISRGFAGLETLSGIPGTVGAAPIQNIGAYGHEVSEFITRVRTYDRDTKAIKTFTNSECQFEYRNSIFKRNPGRYIVLNVQFQIRRGEISTPISYSELASYLGTSVGEKAPVTDVRKAVLALRESKGMLLSEEDRDTWSAGSFFTNPIVTVEEANQLPEGAPRWPMPDGRVKTSAAWLIENSGTYKGEKLGGAQVSSKHVLAITNSGEATATEISHLARRIKERVKDRFGITLEPEVNLVNITL